MTWPREASFLPANVGMRARIVWLAPVALLGAATRVKPHQSPIDLESTRLRVATGHTLPALDFRYAHHATLDVENTGSPSEHATVRANVTSGDGELRVAGVTYRLTQFHWHAPSEHEVDERRFPMELHLVHAGSDGSTLVVGVLVHAGQANAALAPLFDALPTTHGAHVTVRDIDLHALLPDGHWSARYTGSLTTPYTEGVRWEVLAPPLELSSAQIAAFRALFPEGNARTVQPLNGRRAVTDDPHFAADEGVTRP